MSGVLLRGYCRMGTRWRAEGRYAILGESPYRGISFNMSNWFCMYPTFFFSLDGVKYLYIHEASVS